MRGLKKEEGEEGTDGGGKLNEEMLHQSRRMTPAAFSREKQTGCWVVTILLARCRASVDLADAEGMRLTSVATTTATCPTPRSRIDTYIYKTRARELSRITTSHIYTHIDVLG